MPSLEARLQRLEQGAADNALCTDPQCQHLEMLRCLRRVNGESEYPLPPHARKPPPSPPGGLARVLAALNSQPGEPAPNTGASRCPA